MWTRWPLIPGVLMCAALSGCSSCEPEKKVAPAPKPQPSTSAAPVPSEQPLSFERRHLTRREASIEPGALVEKREELLDALDEARKAAKDDAKAAAAALSKVAEQAPMSPVVRLLESRAALDAGEKSEALRAARIAVYGAEGRKELLVDALIALGASLEASDQRADAHDAYERALSVDGKSKPAKKGLEQTAPAAADGGAAQAAPLRVFGAPTDKAVCDAVQADVVVAGRAPLVSATPGESKLTCTPDALLELGAGDLTRAMAFRVDVDGPLKERFIYVAVDGAEGIRIIGPVASSIGVETPGVVNDVLVDLQRIDVLRGGAPEVVIKITERRTVPDPALDEVLEMDRTRAKLLSVDRGKVELSREFVLEESIVRRSLGSKSKKMPKGYRPDRGLGKVAEFHMKVAWSGPNSITLERRTGKATPPVEGQIQLFPDKAP